MAQGINSSFIPKKEVRARSKRASGMGANLFLLVGVIIFLTAILASLGVYLWGEQIDRANARAAETLEKNRESYAIESIEEFIDMNNRISAADMILRNHVQVTQIFEILESETLTDIYLTDFDFKTQDSDVVVSARGYAPTYSHVALQADQYSANTLIKDLILSGVNQSREGGIQFDLNFAIDRDVLLVSN